MSTALAAAVGTWLVATTGQATPTLDDETVRPGITWRAASPCPSAAQLEERLVAQVGAADARAVSGHAAVGVDRSGGYFMRVTLRDGDASSTRTLRATECTTLADAYVLLLSVALGSTPRAEHPTSAKRTAGVVDMPLSAEVSAAGHAEWGVLRQVTGGPAISAALLGRRFRVELETSYAAPTQVTLSADAQLRVQRYEVALAAGPALRWPWGDVAFLLGMSGGGLVTSARGSADVGSPHAPWAAARSAVRLAVALSPRLSLTIAAQGMAALTRIRFRQQTTGARLQSTGPWGARGLVGLAMRFPKAPYRTAGLR